MRTAVLLATLLFTALPAQAIPAADLAGCMTTYLSQSCGSRAGGAGAAGAGRTCYRLLSDVTRLPEFMPG
jgi:hypothetical protein